jgi:aspartyl-tRNA(Asn)/glutamyl-tRNA(Gln) amidotransferase subunit B
VEREWEPVIGLECHVQLATRTKLFSRASAAFGAAPNSHTDPYTLALPGTLPVPSRAAIDSAIKMGLATGCTIRRVSRFARKHYFYPDLPKGFQISQYDEPLCAGGAVELVPDAKAPATRQVRLTRIHVEEDAGKNTHAAGAAYSLVDFNRAGVPLIEIVSEPELRSAAEAGAYLRAVRQLVRWLGISDGNMEEGSLRCDANVSVRPRGQDALGTKTELKNINSFKNVEEAIEFEIARQITALEGGERVVQETRLWDAERKTSHAMRSKEEAHDYRYFPEPDLPPLRLSDNKVDELRAELPELPLARRARYIDALGLGAYDASVLTSERPVAEYFEAVVAAGCDAKLAANWVTSELLGRLHKAGLPVSESPIAPAALAELVGLIVDKTISGKIAKDVFDRLWSQPGVRPRAIVDAEGLVQVTDAGAIEAACREVIAANPKQAEQYRGGKTQAIGFFVGQVMKRTQGKANPALVNEILKRILDEK